MLEMPNPVEHPLDPCEERKQAIKNNSNGHSKLGSDDKRATKIAILKQLHNYK